VDSTAETLRFANVELDVPALTLRVDGEAVHTQPQVFDVLAYLVLHRDRVVSKNELLDNVWGDRFVSESALTTRIKSARRVIGDDGRTQRMIRTVHGRGYQFVADVVTSASSRRAARAPVRTADEFVGRGPELAEVLDALDGHRLVTVVGPGGVGKTRLVTEAARVWEDEGRPVHFVELDAITSEAQVVSLICDVLGVRAQGDVDLTALVAQELRGSAPMLVLDNFEHVGGAAIEVGRLLDLATDLRVCVSSRERLHLSDEQVITLGPLDASSELGRDAPAIVLFEARARRLDRSFTVDDSNVALVAEICRLVDGLPLGLDLAAAQLRHMPLEYLRTHLEWGLAEIALDLHDRPRRQRSVDELIGWSYEQLAPSAQALLARLSVFRGGIPLSGVRAVGEFETDFAALRSMAQLVDKSLVVVEPSGSEPRYSLLNLIRSYAASCLAANSELAAARAAHASWVAEMVSAIEADRWDRNVAGWFGELSREYPNIVAALEHLSEAGDLATLCRIMADTNNWWYNVGRHDEARRWVQLALAAEADLDDRTLGRLHLLSGLLAFAGQDLGGAVDQYELALQHSSAAHDWRYAQLTRASLAIRALADPDTLEETTSELQAVAAEAMGRGEHAVLAYALNYLGVLLHRTGRGNEARAQHHHAIAVNRRIGDPFGEAMNHANIGHVEVEAGRPETALVSSKAALRIAMRAGASVLAAWMLSEIASAERMLGYAPEAVILLGASDAYIDAIGAHRGPAAHQVWHEMTSSGLRDDLGDAEFERLHAVGSALSLKAAVERALASDGR
jgi:predicted ATPase/DNA-binding winged helix-turn-helix (wHTH) protein